jgi:hypothetical protein
MATAAMRRFLPKLAGVSIEIPAFFGVRMHRDIQETETRRALKRVERRIGLTFMSASPPSNRGENHVPEGY